MCWCGGYETHGASGAAEASGIPSRLEGKVGAKIHTRTLSLRPYFLALFAANLLFSTTRCRGWSC